jgi:branched-chain amino acid transport system permease protein
MDMPRSGDRSVTLFFSALVAGIGIGSMYALLALSFGVVYSSTGIFNVAQGDLLTAGVLISFYALEIWHLPQVLALLMILGALIVLSLIEERVAARPFLVRRSSGHALGWFISTLAFGLVVSTLTIKIYGNRPPLAISSAVGNSPLTVGSVTIPPKYILAVVVTLCIGVALDLFYKRSWLGTAMRAVAEDREIPTLRGIEVVYISRMAFIIAAVVTGVAAFVIAPIVYASVTNSLLYGLKGFIALAIGGFGSIRGSIVGGFALGIAEQMFDLYGSSNFEILSDLILLLVVLSVRPAGLFGTTTVRNV